MCRFSIIRRSSPLQFKSFVQGAARPAQWPQIDADDIALLQYTGGTTGLLKGAMLSHAI